MSSIKSQNDSGGAKKKSMSKSKRTRIHPTIQMIDPQIQAHCGVHAINNLMGEIITVFDFDNKSQAFLNWQEVLLESVDPEEEVECPVLNAAYVLLSDEELLRKDRLRDYQGDDLATCTSCNTQVPRVRCLNCTRVYMTEGRMGEVRGSAIKLAKNAATKAVSNGGSSLTTEQIIDIVANVAAQRALEEVTSQREVHSVNALLDADELIEVEGGVKPGGSTNSSSRRRTRQHRHSALHSLQNMSSNYRPLAEKTGNLSDDGIDRLLRALGLQFQRRTVRTAHMPHNAQIFTSTVLKKVQKNSLGFLGIIVYMDGGHYIAFKYAPKNNPQEEGEYVFLDSNSKRKPKDENKEEGVLQWVHILTF